MIKCFTILIVGALYAVSPAVKLTRFRCDLLPDGKYRMEYNIKSIQKPTMITITNSRFSQCCILGDTLRGELKWINDCYLILAINGQLPDTTVSMNKLLYHSFGPHCIELQRTNGDSVFFRTTYTGNVHITINQGYFIRVN